MTTKTKLHPRESEMANLIRDWLTKCEIQVEDVEQQSEHMVNWSFSAGEGVSVYLCLEQNSNGYTFYNFEVALTVIDPLQSLKTMEWLLKHTYNKTWPMRFCMDEKNYVIAKMTDLVEPSNPEYLVDMAKHMVEYSDEILKTLCVKFGVRPFMECLQKQKVS